MEALLKSMGESQMKQEAKSSLKIKEPLKIYQTREQVKKKDNFFTILCNEILTIPNAPWLKGESDKVEGLDYKSIMVEKMAQEMEEKKQADERDKTRGFSLKGPTDKSEWGREYGITEFEEQVNDQLETLEGLLLSEKKPVYDSFGFERGKCQKCLANKCLYYESSNCIINRPGANIFSCINCGCPMNSHRLMGDLGYFSNELAELLMRKRLTTDHLNFKGFVAIFTLPTAKIEELRLGRMSQILNEGGYHMLSYYKTPTDKLFFKLLQREIMNSQSLLNKTDYEAFSEFLADDKFLEQFVRKKDVMLGNMKERSFIHTKRKRNMMTSKIDEYNSVLNGSKIAKSEDQENTSKSDIEEEPEIPKRISDVLIAILNKLENAFRGKETSTSFVMSLVSKEDHGFKDFRRFLVAVADYLPPSLGLFYQSDTKYEGMLDNQVFFPEYFRLRLETFLILPDDRMDQREAQDKMKDAYDFNSCSVIKTIKGNLKASSLLTTISRFMKNASFLVNNLMAENQLIINVCASLGSSSFINMSSDSSPNYYKFTKEEHNRYIFKDIATELFENQRVMLVLRPTVVKNGINELILNLFRINKFTVIKRNYCVLTKTEASFMAKVEKIHVDNFDSYVNMMTDGPLELILVSKFGAFSEAKVICNGCLTGIRSTSFTRNVLAGDLFLDHPMQNSKLREIFLKNHFNVLENLFVMNPFRGIREMMKIEDLILETSLASVKSRDQPKFFINEQTKEVFYEKLSKASAVKEDYQYSNVRKIAKENHLLKIIQNECFNFFIFPSPDQMITEELISIFMPECSSLSLLFLILKPNPISLIESIKDMIVELNFRIVYQQSSNLLGDELEIILNSVFQSKEDFKDNRARVSDYWSKRIEVIGIIKPGCRKEMLSILSEPKIKEDSVDLPVKKEDLSKYIIPCWNNETNDLALSFIDENLQYIEASRFKNLSQDSQSSSQIDAIEAKIPDTAEGKIFSFILINTFGDEIHVSEKKKKPLPLNVMCYLDYDEHIHYKVKSSNLGEFEIRIRAFESFMDSLEFEDDPKSRLNEISFEYQIIGWYYNFINSKFLQSCPVSYQFRIYPEMGTNFDQPKHIYDCQQYVGAVFLDEITDQMLLKHSLPGEEEKLQNLSISMGIGSDRGSVLAYLWGMKLAQFIKKLETLNDESIPGWGKIVLKENTLKGEQFSQGVEHMQAEFDFYQDIKEVIFKFINEYMPKSMESEMGDKMEGIRRVITKNLDLIFKSKSYAYARDNAQRRILPGHLDQTNIRILANREAVFNQYLHKDFKTIMFEYELLANEKDKSLNKDIPTFNDYCLVYTVPHLKSKYSLVANVKYLLEIEIPELPKRVGDSKQNTNPRNKGEGDVFEDQRMKTLIGVRDAFNRIYTMDLEDQDFLESVYKEIITEERFIKKQIPDLIEMELFLICLQEVCNHIWYVDFCNVQIEKLSKKKYKMETDYKLRRHQELIDNVQQISHMNRMAAKTGEEIENLKHEYEAKREVVKTRVKILLDKIESRNILYSYEDHFFKKEHTLNNKVKIPREKYFKPFVEENWEPNIEDQRYTKDLFAGLDRAEGRKRFKDAVIFDVIEKDVIQQAWYKDTPLEVLNLRPMKKEFKDGVIVEKVIPRAEKLQMDAIDEEIRKFRDYMQKMNIHE